MVQAVSIVVLTAMVVINAVNITTRAVFHNDLEWTQEVSLMGAMVIYFFSFGLISKANADIRIEFLVAHAAARMATCAGRHGAVGSAGVPVHGRCGSRSTR